MLTNIRLLSQQLANPQFDEPKDLVNWMGAIQAQDYTMSKWALGIRLKDSTLQQVQQAIDKGEILRTHILRPTWHFVSAENIRWMLQLSGKRILSAFRSYYKGIPEETYIRGNDLIIKMLEGGKSMTKQEISTELTKDGILEDMQLVSLFIARAEAEGIVCNGPDKDKKVTYALLDERVPAMPAINKEEALAKLAQLYFQSHSPATLQDFTWWSGLPVTEAKKAIGSIREELIREQYNSVEYLIHQTCQDKIEGDIFHFLPSYDEYLISYKTKTGVLDIEHHPKAFNNFGIFYPVILHQGRITGNWKKKTVKGDIHLETSFFSKKNNVRKKLVEENALRFTRFHTL